MKHLFTLHGALLTAALLLTPAALAQDRPLKSSSPVKPPKAVILMVADDLGFGDIGCNGAKLIPTPHVDKLAKEGLRFTSAYCTSGTCTPSRYALLTGQYPWRKKGTGVLPGNAAMIIPAATERETLPSIMQKAGYKTCAIGKWHLGLGKGNVDWNQPITFGPKEIGFDESYIMAATADRVPCVYIKNGKVDKLDPKDPIQVSYRKNFEGEPTGKDHPELLRWHPSHGHDQSIVDGISRIGFMKGGKAALWKDQDLADNLTDHAVDFIMKNKKQPFFMYFATNDIHVPRDPHQRFIGKSGCGIRGDVTVQMDACLGRIMTALEKAGLKDDALVIFTSDNGPVVDDGYKDGAKKDLNNHKPAGPFSGGKYSLMEGGTRMPFIVWWPALVKPGTSDAIISQMDLGPTFAAMTGKQASANAFPDGENMLPALLGKQKQGRDCVVIHDGISSNLALRQGDFKYYPPNAFRRRSINGADGSGDKASPKGSLYNVVEDPAESRDLIGEKAELAGQMAAKLAELRQKGTGDSQ